MGLSRRSIELFITDSLNLARKGVLALQRMEQSTSGDDVRKFFHAVHSLKGTAAMVPHSQIVVAPLHRLEARLTLGGSFEKLAQDYINWRDEALIALEEATRGLKGLHHALVEDQSRDEIQTAQSIGNQAGVESSGAEFCYFVAPSSETASGRGFYIPVRDLISVSTASEADVLSTGVLSRDGRWWRVVDLRSGAPSASRKSPSKVLMWVRSEEPCQERVFRLESDYRVVGILTIDVAQGKAIPNWIHWIELEQEKSAA